MTSHVFCIEAPHASYIPSWGSAAGDLSTLNIFDEPMRLFVAGFNYSARLAGTSYCSYEVDQGAKVGGGR